MRTGVLRCCFLALVLSGSILALSAQAEENAATPDAPAMMPSVTPAEAEKLIGGVPRVTIAVKDIPAEEVLVQLRQQSDLNLQFFMDYRQFDTKTKVTFEATDITVWEAVSVLEDKIQGNILLVEDGVRLFHSFAHLQFPETVRTPLYYIGIVRISHEVGGRHYFVSGETERGEQFNLEGMLALDPRLHRFAGANVHVKEIIDDRDGSLVTGNNDFINPYASHSSFNFKIDLKSRPDMGRRIARFKGVISAPVAVQNERWEIPDAPKAAGVSKTVRTNLGDITYRLASVRPDTNDDYVEYTFSMSGPPLGALQGYRTLLFDTIVTAFNAGGKIVRGLTGSGGNDRVRRYGTKDVQNIPARFVLTLPVDIRNLEIPFELKDVALPPTEPAPKVATGPVSPDNEPALTIEEALLRSGQESLVTLQFKETSTDKVVAELSRQSGIPITFETGQEPSAKMPVISVDVQQQPFWTALRAVIAASRLRFAYYASPTSRELRLFIGTQGVSAAEQWQEPVGASGQTRFTARWCVSTQSAVRNFVTKESYVSRPLTIRCDAALPPQLSGIPHTNRLRIDEAVDDKGRSLLYAAGDQELGRYARSYNAPAASLKFEQYIVLQSRDSSRLITSLKGALRLEVAIRTETWEIADVQKAQQVQRSSKVAHNGETYELTYTVDEFSLTAQEFRFRIHVVGAPHGAPIPLKPNAILSWFTSHTHLSDETGYLWSHFDWTVTDSPQGRYLNLRFSRQVYRERTTGTPAKLMLTLPTEIQLVEVPFEFKDLPLP